MREFKFFSDNEYDYEESIPTANSYAEWSNDIHIGLPHLDVWIGVMTLYDEERMCDIISHEVTRYYDMFNDEDTWQETLETLINSLNNQFAAVEVRRLVHN